MSTGSSRSTSDAGQRSAAPAGGGVTTFKEREHALRAGRLGTAGLLLCVLAATAPLMVVAGVMPTTFGVMGIVGQPLLFVLLGVVLLLFGFGYAELSRHVHNAGAFYAYIARGLGGTAGCGAAWVALVAYSALQAGVYGLFGYEVGGLCSRYLHTEVAWWIPALAGVVLVGLLGWLPIGLNARLLGVLLLIEVALVVIFDVSAIAEPGRDGLSMGAFNPHTLTGAGIATSLCFCVAAFLGFEQAPVYSEETRRPQVAVPRVMFLAIGCVAVFFAISSWALTVAAGPSQIVPEARAQSAGLLFFLSEGRLGATLTDVLQVLFVTGIFACMLSFHNVVARYAFAMGREGLLPAVFGRTQRTTGAPSIGSLLQSVVSIVVVASFAASDDTLSGDPTVPVLHQFAWMANAGALGIILLMAVACCAVIVFFVRRGALRAQVWRLSASLLSGLVLFVIAGYTIKNFDILVASGAGSSLNWMLPGIIGLAAVIGLFQGMVLRSLRPGMHSRIGLGTQAFQLEQVAKAGGGN
jgi:amino acid transporter